MCPKRASTSAQLCPRMVAVLFGISLSIKWKREGQSQRQLLALIRRVKRNTGMSDNERKTDVVIGCVDGEL